jgi:toxin ParE1/3/4
MNVRYTPRSQADIKAIYLYLHHRSPQAAVTVVAAIDRQIAQLAMHPFAGPPTSRPGVRGLTIIKYPYKAYYRIRTIDIVILHIRDTRRAPWRGAR